MKQWTRVSIALAILLVLVGALLAVDALRRARPSPLSGAEEESTLAAGSIPIYLDGRFIGGFLPDDLQRLEKVSFADAEEGKQQEGWLLRDVLLLHVQRKDLGAGTQITVGSSSRAKSARLAWAQVDQPANWVMLALSNRGTLKLVSKLEELDTRDEWVQDVDRIEVGSP